MSAAFDVGESDPLKQGLKLGHGGRCDNGLRVGESDPLKQGLKLSFFWIEIFWPSGWRE